MSYQCQHDYVEYGGGARDADGGVTPLVSGVRVRFAAGGDAIDRCGLRIANANSKTNRNNETRITRI